eukprot:scaffold2834_cov366-Prasinococcus_capsulatus_cf.AAC.1
MLRNRGATRADLETAWQPRKAWLGRCTSSAMTAPTAPEDIDRCRGRPQPCRQGAAAWHTDHAHKIRRSCSATAGSVGLDGQSSVAHAPQMFVDSGGSFGLRRARRARAGASVCRRGRNQNVRLRPRPADRLFEHARARAGCERTHARPAPHVPQPVGAARRSPRSARRSVALRHEASQPASKEASKRGHHPRARGGGGEMSSQFYSHNSRYSPPPWGTSLPNN